MNIIAFGEVLWDFIAGDKFFGGAPVNFAAHVVQCGADASIVTALGTDKLGDQALEEIQKVGLDDGFIQRVGNKLTGRVMITLTDGQPSYRIKKDVAFDFIQKSKVDLAKVSQYDAFYFGTLAQRNLESREVLYHILDNTHFKTVFYDVNLRKDCYSKELVEKSFSYSTIVKMNEEEALILSRLIYSEDLTPPLFIERLSKTYSQIKIVIVTHGAQGCTVYADATQKNLKSETIQLKDAVGAGDAFCAAFLTTYVKTNDPYKAARIGNMVGGFVASESGAIPQYPERFKRKVEVLSKGFAH